MTPPRRAHSLVFHLLRGVACCLAVIALAGCANYQLGTGSKLTFTTLYIAPVATNVIIPQAQVIVSTHLREAFARDGRVTLVNRPEDAQATLTIVLTDFRREATVARENDTGLARKFALTLKATCTLRDQRSGQNLFSDRPITAQRDAFTDSGQLQSEYQTVPFLADALTAKITRAVLDVW